MSVVVITGAAGLVGSMLRPRLARPGRTLRLLRTVVQSEGVTALVATHDPNLIDIAGSVLELEDGKIK